MDKRKGMVAFAKGFGDLLMDFCFHKEVPGFEGLQNKSLCPSPSSETSLTGYALP